MTLDRTSPLILMAIDNIYSDRLNNQSVIIFRKMVNVLPYKIKITHLKFYAQVLYLLVLTAKFVSTVAAGTLFL